jgi:hypothetical protein
MSDDRPPAAVGAPISLQLDRADFGETDVERCAICGQPLAGTYYEINSRVCCPACHQRRVAPYENRPGPTGFLRAAAAGFGAAVLGAGIYFAVRAATGYEIGLISIVVGFLVGKAVHWGCRGHGSWLYQVLAVLLTYLAIVSTYVPAVYQGMQHGAEVRAHATAASSAQPATRAGAPAPAAGRRSQDAQGGDGLLRQLAYLVIGVLLLLLIAAAVPFLGGVGILGLIVIAVGLLEAWRLNRRPPLNVTGPHSIAPAGWQR